uniref:Eukaryotic translation initiation factor 3 subunit J n=1 Tax=Strigamia maritima TaxID=126957 RepID=T1J3U0_STRMM
MADGEWDGEDFEPKTFATPRVVDKWEGEDEDDDVKDNWDDEEEESAEPQDVKKDSDTVKAVQVKKKNIAKNKLKEKQEKMKERQMEELSPMAADEVYQEKLRRKQLEEESDLQLAKEAFGLSDSRSNIDLMEPSSREDFEMFKKCLVDKLTKYEKSVHYVTFLEDLLRDLCINLDSDDIKKFTSALNALSSEKAKAAKASKTKKKGAAKKASLVVGKANDFDMGDYGGAADEFDDFM